MWLEIDFVIFFLVKRPCRYLDPLSSTENINYQRAFSSMLPVKARQSSSIRAAAGLGQEPFSNPFDTPLELCESVCLIIVNGNGD